MLAWAAIARAGVARARVPGGTLTAAATTLAALSTATTSPTTTTGTTTATTSAASASAASTTAFALALAFAVARCAITVLSAARTVGVVRLRTIIISALVIERVGILKTRRGGVTLAALIAAAVAHVIGAVLVTVARGRGHALERVGEVGRARLPGRCGWRIG